MATRFQNFPMTNPIPGALLPYCTGNYYFVNYGTGRDTPNAGTFKSPLKTIAYAYAKVISSNDDCIVLMGSSTHVLTATLTVAKNRVTIVGLDGGIGTRFGQNAKISLGVVAAQTGTLINTGVRNRFINIKIINENSATGDHYCVIEGGEYAQYKNVEMYKSTFLTTTGACEFVSNGDSTTLENCTIGSLVNQITTAVRRPCILFTAEIAGAGKVTRELRVYNSMLLRYCGNAAQVFMYAGAAGDIERLAYFENCQFINNTTGTTMTNLIESSVTAGEIALFNCYRSANVTKIATSATNSKVFSIGTTGAAAAGGLAVQAA
jgi:hypothetical protein